MPSDLAPTRLRELIAAATPGPWTMDVRYREVEGGMEVTISIPELSRPQVLTSEQLADWEHQLPNVRLLEFVVNNAPALADALEAKELLEWAGKDIWCREYGWDGEGSILDCLRAAKEASL